MGVLCGISAVFDCLSDGVKLVLDCAEGGFGTKSEGGCVTSGFEV
jgi:hypothetical protein